MREAQKIRIDDLRTPVLTDAQRAALAFGEKNPVSLAPDSVLAAAVERTGLSDFGPDDFRERLGNDARERAAARRDAPDEPRPHPRRARADAARLLELQPGVDCARAALARLLPRARPDAALRLPQDGAPDPPVAAAARALGAEVAAAPRAARPPARDVPRRDDRRYAPRSRLGGSVGRDDARLRRADELPHAPAP